MDPVLQHLDWVRALSLSLVRDAAAADHIVQEVWLVAASKLPKGLSGANSVRSWLAGVARNLARSKQLNRVAQLVLELDEPFRRTMLMHWFEGRGTAEIAALEEIQPTTVHTRLHCGKDLLRKRLDADHGGVSRDWALALVPFTARALATGSGRKLLGAKSLAAAAAFLVAAPLGVLGYVLRGAPGVPPPATCPSS